MNLIAMVDQYWSIGSKTRGQVVINPYDMKRFKALTINNTVIMGRKTYERLPAAVCPLPNRRNIVLSTTVSDTIPGIEVYRKVSDVLDTIKSVPSNSVFVIGGAHVYHEFFPYCDTVYITRIHEKYYDPTDTDTITFPDHLWLIDEFEVASLTQEPRDSDVQYIKYIRRK